MHSHYAPAVGVSAQREGLKVGSLLCLCSAVLPSGCTVLTGTDSSCMLRTPGFQKAARLSVA